MEIARDLAATGASVEFYDAPGRGQQLLARVAGRDTELEPVLVLGHMDTVHAAGSLAERPFHIVDGRVEGPGTYDMKAGLAVAVETICQLAAAEQQPRRPVEVLFTCDEETGSFASRTLIEERARAAAAVLVLEPCLPGGGAKTARKGVATYILRISGRAAHAGGQPGDGVSAITEMAHQILHLPSFADTRWGTTLNVGVVHGGTAGNVVAAEAWAEVDVRFVTDAEQERVDLALRALRPVLAGARLHLETVSRRPPLERTERVIELYERARIMAADLGFDLPEGSSGGGSDGSFTAAQGVPTLDGIGVDGGGAHAANEHVLVADLSRRVALLAGLLQTL